MTADLGPGAAFGPYRLESLLGRGGMSVVYLAEDTRLGRRVAIKVLAPELMADEAFRTRFVRESQLAAGLEHPNIVPVYEAGETDGQLFIAMRYVRGTDLRSLIVSEGPLGPDRTIALLRPVAAALDAAHRRGLVHRDVKPGNILIANDEGEEHVYLSDFGLTKHTTSRSGLTRTGQFMGTVDYVAPEQIQGQEIDGRADEYSLACVLYECLTSRVPYLKDSDVATLFGHIQDPPPKVTEPMPELPGDIDDVIARGMAKDREDRPSTCLALIAEASRALDAPSGPREAPSVPPAPTTAASAPIVAGGPSTPPGIAPPPGVTPPPGNSPPPGMEAPAISGPQSPTGPGPPPPAGGRGSGGGARVVGLFAAAGVALAAVIVIVGLALSGGDGSGPGPSPTGGTAATGATGSSGATGSTGGPTSSPTPSVFTDPEAIGIPVLGEASPYPASIAVSGLDGVVADVNVTISGLTHNFPDDVDIVLVGPQGQSVLLMADVGGRNPVSDITLTFDDSASGALGDRAHLGSRTALPSAGTVAGGGDCCGFQGGPPAPETPPGASLSVFDGTDPNGTWSLFVFDDTDGDQGSISGGWSLEIALAEAPG